MSSTTMPRKRGFSFVRLANAAVNLIDGPVVVLGGLMLLGVATGIARLVTGLGSSTGLNDGYAWGLWIGFDFTMIALSGAGFTMAAVVHIFHLNQFKPAMRPAVLAGLLGYIGVLVLLILDLGRPDRFYGFMISWNLHSQLFEICWCVLLYSMVLFVENAPPIFEGLRMGKVAHLVERFITPVVIIGVTLSSLHQSTLGTLYLAMPYRLHEFWFSPILPLHFFTSSVMAGLSLAVVTYLVANNIRKTQPNLRVASGLAHGAAWAGVVYLALKIGDAIVAGHVPGLLTNTPMATLWRTELFLGAIVPVILLLIPSVRASRRGLWLGTGLFLAGVLLNRFDCTLFAQTGRAGTAYAPSIMEWVSTIGIIAGVALAWYLAVKLLPVLEGEHHPAEE